MLCEARECWETGQHTSLRMTTCFEVLAQLLCCLFSPRCRELCSVCRGAWRGSARPWRGGTSTTTAPGTARLVLARYKLLERSHSLNPAEAAHQDANLAHGTRESRFLLAAGVKVTLPVFMSRVPVTCQMSRCTDASGHYRHHPSVTRRFKQGRVAVNRMRGN
ncbi:hypothetical protein E2C01_070407 [Portunus trituberculatus]|uniref:Uncharacterized protein n=1 Tax=Portunus trituberculatus TaxID=210409 RepID=A0A5B7I213_PORTR|nr:hypothetical protein [Portunus trituberculatus]